MANDSLNNSRRQFLSTGAKLATATALSGALIPPVHAAGSDVINIGIIGCGPRGRGAVINALSSPNGPCKLVAMADLFEDKLNLAHKSFSEQFKDQVDVPADRRFLGFDAYRKVIDSLKPGDIAMLTTRAAFRPTHLEYAVTKGVNVFMEKSFAADCGSVKRLIGCAEIADKKNLKIAAGLQCRHSTARKAMIEKIREGAMGDLTLIRAYRMQGGGGTGPRRGMDNELLWQIRNSIGLLWSSTGVWMDNMIHQVDECCWLKDAWPVSAHGMGGRTPYSKDYGQNFDTYSIEYTFADGAKALVNGRFLTKCYDEFTTFAHGTKCAGQFSGPIHAPDSHLYKDQRVDPRNIAWKPEKETINPWQAEWDNLLADIRANKPHNETKRAALANLTALMGRAAVHCGRIVTFDEALNSNFTFVPNIDTLTESSPAPVQPDSEGRYPAPSPGKWTEI